jgi:hypothetical protein
MSGQLLTRAIRWLAPHLPEARRDLVSGLVSEAAAIPGAWARWRWLCGGLAFTARSAMTRTRVTWLAAFGGTGALLYWLNGNVNNDIASQYCLALLLAGGAVHGSRFSYRWAWLPGAALGLVLPASGLIAIALGHHGARQPASAAAAASLIALVIPSVAAAYAGAWLARRIRPRPPGQEDGR